MLNKLINMQNYIFDMDGTLVNSSETVLLCLKKACQNAGQDVIENNLTPNIIGPPLKEIIKLIISDKTNEAVLGKISAEFRKIYDNYESDSSPMYENTYEWLITLKNSGKRLFLATNKPKIPTMRLIKKLKLDMFEDIYTIDKYTNRSISKIEMIENIINNNNLEKNKTIMVGDAKSDIDAAHCAGIKAIGVLWGYCRDKQSLKESSDFIMDINELKVLETV